MKRTAKILSCGAIALTTGFLALVAFQAMRGHARLPPGAVMLWLAYFVGSLPGLLLDPLLLLIEAAAFGIAWALLPSVRENLPNLE
jgi:hypothetical protein